MKTPLLASLLLLLITACNDQSVDTTQNTQQEADIELPQVPSSFTKAKTLLYDEVHARSKTTFYCGCQFTSTRRVYLGTCDVTARKNEDRAKQLEAEHIFPASHFGQYRACWREELCTKTSGETYGGRDCCEKIDPVFRAAHNDLHNLQPSVGEINGDRSNFQFGMVAGEPRNYGACDFEVDFDTDLAEPPEQVRGNIARTYFYMRDTYNFQLSDQQTKLFMAWHEQDPVDDWEIERNYAIETIQGVGNHYISAP